MARLLLVILLLTGIPGGANAQSDILSAGSPDLYFLSVGAGNHSDPDFPAIQAPERSAKMVARSLMQAGARYGILMTSAPEDGTALTRDDFYQALLKLKKQIRADRPARPRILIYVQMHGIGDAANGYLFMIPDNLEVRENPLTQDLVFPLAHQAILNLDIIGGLAWFRMDDRFTFLDDFRLSDMFPERLGLGAIFQILAKQKKLNDQMNEIGKTFADDPPDNTPVPFLVLLDNCSAGVSHTISKPSEQFNAMALGSYESSLQQGIAIFAVEPGRTASTWALPKHLTQEADKVPNFRGDLVPPVLGPLAVHLRNVLTQRTGEPMRLADLYHAMKSSGMGAAQTSLPPPPYVVDTKVFPQVSLATFLPAPAPHPAGQLERVPLSGAEPITCCGD